MNSSDSNLSSTNANGPSLKGPFSGNGSVFSKVIDGITVIECVVMIFGSGILIGAIARKRELRQRRELVLIGCSSLNDLLYGLGHLSSQIRKHFSLYPAGHTSPIACLLTLHNLLIQFGATASAQWMIAISVDRLIAVKWFLLYRQLTLRYVGILFGVVNGSSAVIMVLMGLSSIFGSTRSQISASCLTLGLLFPKWMFRPKMAYQISGGLASVLIFLYAWVHRRQSRKIYPSKSQLKQYAARQNKMTQLVGITTVVTVFFCVIPFSLMAIFQGVESLRYAFPTISLAATAAIRINYITSMFIYGISIQDIRNSIKELFGIKSQKAGAPKAGASSSSGKANKSLQRNTRATAATTF